MEINYCFIVYIHHKANTKKVFCWYFNFFLSYLIIFEPCSNGSTIWICFVCNYLIIWMQKSTNDNSIFVNRKVEPGEGVFRDISVYWSNVCCQKNIREILVYFKFWIILKYFAVNWNFSVKSEYISIQRMHYDVQFVSTDFNWSSNFMALKYLYKKCNFIRALK